MCRPAGACRGPTSSPSWCRECYLRPVRIRLCWSVLLPVALSFAACDKESNDSPATTTSEDTGGEGNEHTDGCVPPPAEGNACISDDACGLAGDCCGCSAYVQTSVDPLDCGGSCTADKCEEWGITNAACQSGRCVAVGLSCNQALVTCDAAPPECDAGSLPQVWDGCFTGACLPREACDWAPDCGACGEGELCMHERRGGCDYVRCVEAIVECQGEPACCTGESWCGPAACTSTADGFVCG